MAENTPENKQEDPPKKDVVAYETHEKLLREKKNLAEKMAEMATKIAEVEKREKERVEAELKQKEDWKKLYEAEKAEKEKTLAANNDINTRLQNGAKMRAFLDKVNGQVSESYWALVDLDGIVINPESGQPDEASAQKVAAEFEKKYPEILKKPGNTPGMPNNAAQGGGASLTYDQWKALPLKDQKARLKEVIASNK